MSIKKKISFCILIVLIIGFIISPLSKYILSLGVMSVYSKMEEDKSIMHEKNIDLRIPGGLSTSDTDWYPFVMTFNSKHEFGKYTNEENLELTILYNFPAFDMAKGCSRLYDPSSSYYSSFYGAYLVTTSKAEGDNNDDNVENSRKYGFHNDGKVNAEEIGLIPEYDLKKLILRDFGLPAGECVFDWKVADIVENMSLAGSEGWTKVDADINMNGLLHEKKQKVQSYIQYGKPNYDLLSGPEKQNEFEPVEMVGRVYCKYIEDCGTSVFLYILTKDKRDL